MKNNCNVYLKAVKERLTHMVEEQSLDNNTEITEKVRTSIYIDKDLLEKTSVIAGKNKISGKVLDSQSSIISAALREFLENIS